MQSTMVSALYEFFTQFSRQPPKVLTEESHRDQIMCACSQVVEQGLKSRLLLNQNLMTAHVVGTKGRE